MGDVIDLEEYRRRRARDAGTGRDAEPERGRRRDRKVPLCEPAAPSQDGTDDQPQD
jgi:hypothetical protein